MWALLVFCFLIFAQVLRADQPVNLWLQYGQAGDKAFRNHDYAKAESLYLAAIERAASFGLQRQSTDPNLSRLMRVYGAMDRYSESEKKFREELYKAEHQYGTDHPGLLLHLNSLALLETAQGQFDQALSLLERSLSISTKAFPGGDSPGLAPLLNVIAFLTYARDKNSEQAELLFRRSMKMREKSLRQDPLDDAMAAANRAFLLQHGGRFDESARAFVLAIALVEKEISPNHAILAIILEDYATLLRKMNTPSEANKLEAKARIIRSKMHLVRTSRPPD
jgi:tetratricopeptide (TPR) repeat protein